MAEPPALVAPDTFKGTFSAREVAAAVARGLRSAGREAVELPVADGGEGTIDALMATLGGEQRSVEVSDPLGRPIEAAFALIDGGRTAVVEMAQASGLGLVAEDERDAWAASTRGTGELIAAAVEAGAERVIVTVGGSATTDGGAGALEALADAGVSPDIEVLCDVRTPFEDAARVFGPQKGADEALVRSCRSASTSWPAASARDPRGEPMTGAAGGLSGGLWAEHGARLQPGRAFVLDALGFDERMREAAFVVTGEGRIDEQTLQGKIVGEVATRCRQAGVPCHAVVGKNDLDPFAERILDFASRDRGHHARRARGRRAQARQRQADQPPYARRATDTGYASLRKRRIASSDSSMPSVTRVGSNTRMSSSRSRSGSGPVERQAADVDALALLRPGDRRVVDGVVVLGEDRHAAVKALSPRADDVLLEVVAAALLGLVGRTGSARRPRARSGSARSATRRRRRSSGTSGSSCRRRWRSSRAGRR